MDFRDIPDFPNYKINENGVVKNVKTNKIMKQTLGTYNYYFLNLSNETIKAKSHQIHRLVGLIFIPNDNENYTMIDHIDNNKHNNNVNNLRWVNSQLNNRNKTKIINTCSSNYYGVYYDKARVKWASKISINNRTISMGRYNTEREAAVARDQYIIDNNLQNFKMNNVI